MNQDDISKIQKYDLGEFLADEISKQGTSIKKFATISKIPYWKLIKQRTYARDLSFREFLIVMIALNISIDSFVSFILNNTVDSKRKQIARDLNASEVDKLIEIMKFNDLEREKCFEILDVAIDLVKQSNTYKGMQ